MNNIDNIISQFSTISLEDMDDVKLMSRTDTKFTFSIDKLSVLLKKLIPFYRVLSINKKLVHDYK